MARLLYKFHAEGVWFSRNGAIAYENGEKPLFMWSDKAGLLPTVAHHISRERSRNIVLQEHIDYSRELVMFYKKK